METLTKAKTVLSSFIHFFLLDEYPEEKEKEFQKYYKNIFLDFSKYILWLWVATTLILWPTDPLFFSGNILKVYMLWRGINLVTTVFILLCIYFFRDFIRTYFNSFIVITVGIIGNASSGLLFGASTDIGSPWFGIVFLLPLYSFIFPVGLFRRIVIAHIFSFVYYISFVAPYPSYSSWDHHGMSIFLTVYVSTLLAIIGNFYFRLIRNNFFKEKKLERQQEEVERERERSDKLLLNILPEEISHKLKNNEDVSERFDSTTVLFADIVNFTPLANELEAEQLVNKLDQIFSTFDQRLEKYELEKIKTIGDEYFVVGGVPKPSTNHAVACAEFATDLMDIIPNFTRNTNESFELRIGLNTGPLIAGIIGEEKFVYDVWGDTVNIGSRMESQCEPGKIHVTAETRNAIMTQNPGNRFEFTKEQKTYVKGRGEITSYYLNW